MKTIGVVVVVALAVVIPTAARGDIVVFRNGTYQEGTIKSVTDESLTMESPYGDLPYARNLVQSVHRSVPEQPGQEYYQAGLMLLQLHKKQTAKKLFEQAAGYDERYGKLGAKALRDYTPEPSKDVESRLRAPKSGDSHSRVPAYRIQCKLCNGTGKVEYGTKGIAGLFNRVSPLRLLGCGGSETQKRMMVCPACSGKGYRLLHLSAGEGICPTCGGAGSVKETEDKEGSWMFNYVPCRDCGGRGIKPIKDGGTREGTVQVSSGRPPGGPSGGYEETEDEDEDEDKDKEKESSDDRGFISRYRMYLLIGGGALLVVAVVASQASKKKK